VLGFSLSYSIKLLDLIARRKISTYALILQLSNDPHFASIDSDEHTEYDLKLMTLAISYPHARHDNAQLLPTTIMSNPSGEPIN
jgi:hypothetical protein